MKRFASIVVTVVLLLSIGVVGTMAQGEETGVLRFVHAIPGVAALDVYTDGQLTVRGLDFGEASNYIRVPAGERTITVSPEGLGMTLWDQQVEATPGSPQTLIASNAEVLQFDSFADDFTPVELGTTRFKAIHAISGGPSIDLLAGGDQVASDLGYGEFIGTFDVPAGVYELMAFPTGGSEDDALLPGIPFSLISNTTYMLVVYGQPDIPEVMLLAAPTAGDGDSGSVRLVHGAADGPAVDIYADNTLIAASLEAGDVTEHLALPAGTYSVELRAAGTDGVLGDAALTVEADAALTAAALGAEDELSVEVFDDSTGDIDSESALVSVLNAIPGESSVSLTLADGTSLAEDLSFGTANNVTLAPTEQPVTVEITVDEGTQTAQLDEQTFYGGVYYNVVVLGGDTPLVIASTSIAQSVGSAPGAGDMAVVELPPTETPEPEVVVEPTEAPTPEEQAVPTEAPSVPETDQPTARVLLDPGANLHLRQYPSADAKSLGLAPSGSVLIVNGREGAPVDLEGNEIVVETEDGQEIPFVDPAESLGEDEDLDPEATWLNVVYNTPDGGQIEAWVNALYVEVRDPDGDLQKLADLETIPQNRAGEAINTDVTPPPVPEDRVSVRTFNLDAGANLNIRRTPEVAGEVLARLPNDTVAELVGLNEAGDWAFVRYSPPEGGSVTGWVSTQYVEYEFNGESISLEDMQIRGLLEIIDETRRGEVGAEIEEVSPPTQDPTRNAYVATVQTNPGTNLNLRRTPDEQAEVVARIPSGSQVVVAGRTQDGLWLQTSFEEETGWIASGFVSITFNGIAADIEDIPVATE